jgi:hypothetical protein
VCQTRREEIGKGEEEKEEEEEAERDVVSTISSFKSTCSTALLLLEFLLEQ